MKARNTFHIGYVICFVLLAMITAQAQVAQSSQKANPFPPPPNDRFDAAEEKTGYHWYAYGVTKGATRQRKEVGKAIWYSWTAPASGPVLVQNWNEEKPFGTFNVYTGTNSMALKRVKPLKKNRLYSLFLATMGTTYHLSAERKPSVDSPVDFTMELLLTTLALTEPTNNSKASEPIPLSVVTTELPSMVASVKYYAQSFPLGYGAAILVGEYDSPPYSGVWNNPIPGHWYIHAELTRTDGYLLETAKKEIRIRPANDNFNERTVLDGSNITISDDIAEATLEPGEPAANQGLFSGSIWYTWTAPGDGYVFIPHLYGNMFEAINVFTGSTLSTLSDPISISDHAGNDVPFPISAGETLQIAVFNMGVLSLRFLGVPANDDFASAIEVAGTDATLTGNHRAATLEPGEPTSPEAGGYTVWYRWTAPANGTLILEDTVSPIIVVGPGGGWRLSPLLATVYAGDAVTNLSMISAGGLGGPVQVPVLGGTTYHIALDNNSTSWSVGNLGDFTVELSFSAAQPN